MQKKRREACHFSGSAVFDVTGVKGSFKGTRIAGEVGERSKDRYMNVILLKNMNFIWR